MITFDPHTSAGARVIELIDELLRLHGRWQSMAKKLAEGTEIRSLTRGLVLSAVVCASEPPTVARIARSLGYTRQAIQRLADDLVEQDYLRFEENPHHKRAKQLVPTTLGLEAYRRSNAASVEWADQMGKELGEQDLTETVAMLRRVRRYLEVSSRDVSTSDEPGARARRKAPKSSDRKGITRSADGA